MHKRCGWQDGLASRRLRRLQSGRRDCTSISTTGVLRSRLNLEVLFYEPCRASDGVCPVASSFTVQFKCLLIRRVWRRIPAHFRLHYSELAEKTNVTAEDVNPTSRWVEFKPYCWGPLCPTENPHLQISSIKGRWQLVFSLWIDSSSLKSVLIQVPRSLHQGLSVLRLVNFELLKHHGPLSYQHPYFISISWWGE